MRWFLLISLLLPISLQRSIQGTLLNGKTHFTEISLERYLMKLERLNRIHQELNDIPVTANSEQSFYDRLESDDNAQPDQIPFLFEGDIILTDDQMDSLVKDAEDALIEKRTNTTRRGRKSRSMTSNLATRWTTFPIPYYLTPGVSASAVQAGISKWEQETCVTFQQQYNIPSGNGLQFFYGDGCFSYIGRAPYRAQTISIGRGCESLGIVTHEIGHALGFYHEQSRSDRNYFVNIFERNIDPQYTSQFTAQRPASMMDYGVSYDYGSVMHYDQRSFSIGGGAITIQSKDANYQDTMGQRVGPAFADVKKINLAYCADKCKTSLPCANGGYTDPKDCSKCRCPDGFGGVLCDKAAVSSAACGAGDLTATSEPKTISMRGQGICNYVIKAPEGKKVYFEVNTFAFSPASVCAVNYLEIKYDNDKSRTGARLCRAFPGKSYAQGNELAVLYRGGYANQFSLTYRYDPQDVATTPTPQPTTVEPSPQPTTAEPTPQRSPTPAPFTPYTPVLPTKQPVTNPTTALPCGMIAGYPRIILFPGAHPIPLYPGQPLLGISTTTPTPLTSTSVKTITQPVIQCTPWTQCSATCGGCGTKSRTCSTGPEKSYCNFNPCPEYGGYCCKPFVYTIQGICAKHQTDRDIILQKMKQVAMNTDGPAEETFEDILLTETD